MVPFGGQELEFFSHRAVTNTWKELAIKVQTILQEHSAATPESLQTIEDRFIDFLKEQGIISDDLPKPVVFVDSDQTPIIDKELRAIGSAFVVDSMGFSSVLYGNVVVLKKEYSEYNHVWAIAEEIYHSLGEQVIAYNPKTAIYARNGFNLSRTGKSDYGWFLEEAIAKYYSYLFVKKLVSEGMLTEDSKRFEKKIHYFAENGRYRDDKVIFKDNRFFANPFLCFLKQRENEGETIDVLALQTPDIIAADIFLDLLNQLNEEDRQLLLKKMNEARKDHTKIAAAANLLDSLFGNGTYISLMKCEATFESVFELREKFKSKLQK